MGLLERKLNSEGVTAWGAFEGVGVDVLDLVRGPGFEVGSSGASGFGGAHEPLLAPLVLILSISTLRNGSGSRGSITSISSARLGLCGLAGFEGVNVT